MDEEIWKPIEGYEGYLISNFGRVKSLKTNGGIILKTAFSINGYKRVCLSKHGTRKNYFVARLVAEAFIPNPDNKPQVNHKDGNKEKNWSSNLEWATAKENTVHAERTGLRCQVGSGNNFSKLSETDVMEIKSMLDDDYTCKSISEIFDVTRQTISHIKNNKTWTHV